MSRILSVGVWFLLETVLISRRNMLTLAFVCIICGLLYYYMTWNNDFWKKRGVPHEHPTFFFGSLKDVLLGRRHFGEIYRSLYRKFENEKYIGFHKMRVPGLIVKDPELIKAILVQDFASFSSNDFQVSAETDPIWAMNIFSQNGEHWRKNRTAWTIGMTASKIKATYDAVNIKADIMVDYVRDFIKNNPNESMNAKTFVSIFFTDTIATAVFGMESNSFHTGDSPLRNITKNMFISSFWENLTTVLYLIAPELGSLLKIRFVPKRVEGDLMEVSRQILESRRKDGFHKTNPFDAMLLHAKDQENLQAIDVAGFLFSFLLDGTESSGGVTAYLLYSLAKNPLVQNKLRAEIDNATENSNGKLSYEEIHNLKYLDMVFSETMRMYPPALSMQRLCTKPFELPASSAGGRNIVIPVGMSVIIPVLGLQTDPKYFPNPDTFDPERFSKKNKDKINKFTYLPFGEGPRHCIGSRLAINQIKVCVAALVKNFEIRLTKKMLDTPLTIDPNFFLMNEADGIHITFHNR